MNSRFAVSIHILTLLAREAQCTSEYIAGSVNTNPVVIRRLLASLRAAKLVASQGGPGGGWVLLRQPQAISLKDVYRAVEEADLFALHPQPPAAACPVGGKIQKALTPRFASAQEALEADLAKTTIKDMLQATSRA